MKKKQLIPIVLMAIGIVILSVGYVILKDNNEKKDKEEQQKQEGQLIDVYDFNAEDVVRIDCINGSGSMSLVQNDGAWIEESTNVPLDYDKVQEMVSCVSNFDAIRTIVTEAKPEEISEFGLDNPTLSYTITLSDGTKYSAVFGAALVTEVNGYYAILDNETTVYSVSDNYFKPFNVSISSLTEIADQFEVEAENITSLSVDIKGASPFEAKYVGDKYGEDQYYNWDITKPYDTIKADTDSINTQLSYYTSIAYKECVSYNCADLSEYGLDDPFGVIKLGYKTENGEAMFILNIGDSFEDDQNNKFWYAMPEGSGNVYTISDDDVSHMINIEPYSLVDKCVYSVVVDELKGYDVEYKGKKFEVKRTGETKKDAVYYVNGKEVDTDALLTLYAAAFLITISGETDEGLVKENPDSALTITYHENSGRDVVVKYLDYGNENFYQVNNNGVTNFLTDKRGIDDLISRYDKFEEENL